MATAILTISVREAVRRTGAPRNHVVAALKAGELRGKRMAWGWLVYPDGLEEWVGLKEAQPKQLRALPAKVEQRLRRVGL